jgi:hypothetical protein
MTIEQSLKNLPEHLPIKYRLVTVSKLTEIPSHELIRVFESEIYNSSQTQGIVNYRPTSKLVNLEDE